MKLEQDITLIHGDCLEVMTEIKSGSIDMICCDLPYGTTQCSYDIVIDIPKMWEQYRRILKPTGNILLFSDEPFTSLLISSNIGQFKQRITWDKVVGGGHLNSKKMLLKTTEDICLFTLLPLGNQTYNPQYEVKPIENRRGDRKREKRPMFKGGYVGSHNGQVSNNYDENVSYPKNIIRINAKTSECNSANRLHSHQKPVSLIEYLIKTYTNEGDLVLDNCMGSGTTPHACFNLNRRCIGIEKEFEYFEIAQKRLKDAQRVPLLFSV